MFTYIFAYLIHYNKAAVGYLLLLHGAATLFDS